MYYEEKIINGVLMCRTTPSGEWRQCSIEKIGEYMVELQKLRELVAQQQWPDEDDPRQQAIEQNGNDGAVYQYMPKVGEMCEAYSDDVDPEECRFLESDEKDAVVKWAKFNNGGYDVLPLSHWKFRPLRTERERFTEAAKEVLIEFEQSASACERAAGALFDAGFKAPEVSE